VTRNNAKEIAGKGKKATKMKDIKVSILGHIQRGSPSAQDRILASQLGVGHFRRINNW
jgi:6-phosphofructokinase